MTTHRGMLLIALVFLASGCALRPSTHTATRATEPRSAPSNQSAEDSAGSLQMRKKAAKEVAPSVSLPGTWQLQINDLSQKSITTMTMRFTEKPTKTCLEGSWYEVIVESTASSDPDFFPMSEPLSYQTSGNTVRIGRHHICESYFQLRGNIQETTVNGQYIAFGWDQEELGTFTLTQIEKE